MRPLGGIGALDLPKGAAAIRDGSGGIQHIIISGNMLA
jgi:hypothetical protein